MKLEHYFLYRDVDVDIKKVDKIEITDVDCYEGPNDTLIITKNNYPKFDELLSILEKYNGRSGCTSYIDISFYKVNKYFGYTRNLGYKTIDFSASRSSYKDEKEAYNAIKQAKEWFKKKQKL